MCYYHHRAYEYIIVHFRKEPVMFGISLNNKQPIYEQLCDSITKLVISGVLEPNSPLPSVRETAAELAVNPNTVQKAFTELERSGVAYSVNGKGRFVTDDIELLRKNMLKSTLEEIKPYVLQLKKYGADKKTVVAEIEKMYGEDGQ